MRAGAGAARIWAKTWARVSVWAMGEGVGRGNGVSVGVGVSVDEDAGMGVVGGVG